MGQFYVKSWPEISDCACKPDWPWGTVKVQPLLDTTFGVKDCVLLYCWGLVLLEQLAWKFKVVSKNACKLHSIDTIVFLSEELKESRAERLVKLQAAFFFFLFFPKNPDKMHMKNMNLKFTRVFIHREIYDRERIKSIQNHVYNFKNVLTSVWIRQGFNHNHWRTDLRCTYWLL